jgi:hypothetical protein
MTEDEWLASTDSRSVWKVVSGKISNRKIRLLICACCRRVWDLLVDDRSREAVEVAERYADGSANREDLIAVRRKADAAYQWARKQHGPNLFRLAGAAHLAHQATSVANKVRFDPREDEFLRGAKERKDKTERKARCELIRDLMGNPFRPVALDPAWSAWNDGTVHKLAQAIYDERAFDRLPILADALEEAGCTNQDILTHCRQPGEHVRGCWVIDALLGKS